jgi:hypothetical protein
MRHLPESDRYASCPDTGNILAYYHGVFDAVFIALHKFYIPKENTTETAAAKIWQNRNEIRQGCIPLTWRDVQQKTQINKLSTMDVALRTLNMSIPADDQDQDAAAQVLALESSNVLLPSEGVLCAFLEHDFLKALQRMGYDWVWVGDEFCTERALQWIDDILDHDAIPRAGNTFTPDYKLLLTTHWDSHCSYICGDKERVSQIVDFGGIEGFYCTENTPIHWGLAPENTPAM